MVVGVDARSLRAGRGIARATGGMLRALAERHPDLELRLLVAGGGEIELPHPALVLRRDPRPQRALFALAATTGRPRLDALLGGDVDVVWLPAPAPVAVGRGPGLVLTVHDLSWETRPGDFTPYERAWHRLARPALLARRADAVVCDSAATATLMRGRWDVAAAEVIGPGLDPPRSGVVPEPGRYLLWVGALEPRKDPATLRRGFALARAAGLDAELLVVGTGRQADRLRGPGIRHLGAVAPERLDALYAGALALVMPSREEGYGLPPLEAALRATPSVLSDLPVFAETLGDTAVRVAPGDADALGAALVRIAADPGLRRRLGRAARERAGRRTWSAAADAMHRVLTGAAR